MRAYVLTVVVIDFDDVEGTDGIGSIIENARYPNRCINPDVVVQQGYEIGEWEDSHPMNYTTTDKLAWLKEHGVLTRPGIEKEERAAMEAEWARAREDKAKKKAALLAGMSPEERELLS